MIIASAHETQSDVIATAHAMLAAGSGGEFAIMGLDGQIWSKDTIAS